ncbi:hypothetical protein DESC_180085 [Desulfosarcina cetonica]|nr:hypothetical protein DESC_180085 [Desulfosarcina cetonica]
MTLVQFSSPVTAAGPYPIFTDFPIHSMQRTALVLHVKPDDSVIIESISKVKRKPNQTKALPQAGGFTSENSIDIRTRSVNSGPKVPQGLIGNPVKIGDGPAAVFGDEIRNCHCFIA